MPDTSSFALQPRRQDEKKPHQDLLALGDDRYAPYDLERAGSSSVTGQRPGGGGGAPRRAPPRWQFRRSRCAYISAKSAHVQPMFAQFKACNHRPDQKSCSSACLGLLEYMTTSIFGRATLLSAVQPLERLRTPPFQNSNLNQPIEVASTISI